MTKHPELKLKSIKTLLIIFFTELVLYVTRVAPLSYAWRARSFTYFYAHCLLQILLYLMLKQSHTNVLPHAAWLICNQPSLGQNNAPLPGFLACTLVCLGL